MQWFYDNQTQIGEIRGKSYHNKPFVSPIYAWKNYGVVCPTEATTNGNAELVASIITGMYYEMHHDLKDTAFTIECVIDGVQCETENTPSITTRLVNAFYKHYPKIS